MTSSFIWRIPLSAPISREKAGIMRAGRDQDQYGRAIEDVKIRITKQRAEVARMGGRRHMRG